MKRFILILLAFFLLPLSSLATDVSGPVSGTWTLAGSPYNVIGEISIPAGQELVIEPGVQVIFQGWYKFLIYGRLQAIGTETDSITITAANTTTGWHGLRFYDISTQPDSSRLRYCHISFGRSSERNGAGEDKNGGAIYCANSDKLLIANCLFDHNHTADVYGAPGQTGDPGTPGENVTSGHGGAIYLTQSAISISNCEFLYNNTGDATGGWGGAGNSYSGLYPNGDDGGPGGNAESGSGGAIYGINASTYLIGNKFVDNMTGEASGGAGGSGGSAMVSQYGGSGYGGNANLGGTSKSGDGGAVCIINGDHQIAYNVFMNNFAGNSTGGFGGLGGTAYWSAYNIYGSTQGGEGAQGNWGKSGFGGSIYLAASAELHHNLFFDFNRTGYGRGGDGGRGGGGNMYGSYYSNLGGDGGDGGDGYGGDGGCIFVESSASFFQNVTISLSLCGQGIGGNGGYGGFGQQNGSDGQPGNGTNGVGVIRILGADACLSNCILWNNGNTAIAGNVEVGYSCIQGGYSGTGNINVNPLFVDPATDDYHLQSTTGSYHGGLWLADPNHSPCIDAGDPESVYELERQPNGGRINMGFEGNTPEASLASIVSATSDPAGQVLDYALQPIRPNPFNNSTVICFQQPARCRVSLKVFDVQGRMVSDLIQDWRAVGFHDITFDASDLSSGIYLVRFEAGDFEAVQKMVLLK